LGNQNAELTEISKALVNLGRTLDVPVIAASQLSRDVERRSDKRPMLSDLRDSGSLEQDGYAVIFLYRDDYYNELSLNPNVAEMIVAKHREGPTGTNRLFWNKELTSFRNLDSREIVF
jgi:replicative DNA helicase